MKTKVILISVIVLLIITVVYIVYSKKKQQQEDVASQTSGTPVAGIPIMSGSPVQAGYVEPTSGVVSSKPKPIAAVTTTVGSSGAASVVAVLSNPLNLANCKIRCGALYPINKSKREACQAACK